MGPLPASRGCTCRICRPDDSYFVHDRKTIDCILEHGWQVVYVSPDGAACDHPEHDHSTDSHPHDADTPGFGYTVGLGHRCEHPELLISGLDHLVACSALNEVARRVMAGRRLAPGEVLEGVLAGVPIVVERVAEHALPHTVPWSEWFHRRQPDALMLVWPSVRGLFAWQPGAPKTLDRLQPPEWREPFRHVGGVTADPDWTFPVPPDRMAISCTHVVEDGEAVFWVARTSDPEHGEDWFTTAGPKPMRFTICA
jgi:hypothetical protein